MRKSLLAILLCITLGCKKNMEQALDSSTEEYKPTRTFYISYRQTIDVIEIDGQQYVVTANGGICPHNPKNEKE